MNAVDTNVFVYAVDDTEPAKSRVAMDLLQQLIGGTTPLVVLLQTAVEFLACLRRWEGNGRISRSDTIAYLQQFILTLRVVHPTVATLATALDLSERHSLSHWDSMILAACAEAGVTTFYSEDLTNGAIYGSVKVLNPFAISP